MSESSHDQDDQRVKEPLSRADKVNLLARRVMAATAVGAVGVVAAVVAPGALSDLEAHDTVHHTTVGEILAHPDQFSTGKVEFNGMIVDLTTSTRDVSSSIYNPGNLLTKHNNGVQTDHKTVPVAILSVVESSHDPASVPLLVVEDITAEQAADAKLSEQFVGHQYDIIGGLAEGLGANDIPSMHDVRYHVSASAVTPFTQ